MVDPYQLGHGNSEGLKSGAWWFYQKLGFRARDAQVLELMESELATMKRKPSHRSSLATLTQLSGENVYLHLGRQRDDVIGMLDVGAIGLRVATLLAQRHGADREAGLRETTRDASGLLGVAGELRRWSADEREAFTRWSPLVLLLPGLPRWSASERRGLVNVIRAKGRRRESDYARLFDAHSRLRRAVVSLAVQE
jgi:hypothetical protein